MAKEFIDDYEDDFYPKKEAEIQIPEFITGENVIPTEEQLQMNALVNNVPNNTELENQKDLEEMGRVSKNWSIEIWKKIIINADAHLMLAEIDRRMEQYEKHIDGVRNNLQKLETQNL